MSLENTINQFYQAIINKNVDSIKDAYYPSEDTYVVLEGPRLTTRGFEKISKGWTDFCSSPLSLTKITWIEGPLWEAQEGMAWLSGVVTLAVQVQEKLFERTFRASFVLVKYQDNWKIKHEHVSAALEDPYGIGDWLKSQ